MGLYFALAGFRLKLVPLNFQRQAQLGRLSAPTELTLVLCSRRVHRGGDLPSVVSWPRTHPCFQLPPFPLPLLSLPRSGFDSRLRSFSRVGSCPGREAWGWGSLSGVYRLLQPVQEPSPPPTAEWAELSSFQPLTSGCPSALERSCWLVRGLLSSAALLPPFSLPLC